jgi:hypothetical protein
VIRDAEVPMAERAPVTLTGEDVADESYAAAATE